MTRLATFHTHVRTLGLAALCLCPTLPSAQEVAEGREIVSDGINRIEQASLLPMLTQRVAAVSCAMATGINEDDNHVILDETFHQFEQIVLALRDGDPALHIMAPETRSAILADIDKLWTDWAPVHDALEVILQDHHNMDAMHIIDDHNIELLDDSTVLVSDVTGVYSDPYVLTQTDAMMFTIMGRQRTLSQQMAKDACEVWSGYHVETAREELSSIMGLFERSLYALRDGAPSVGIQPAPTDEIRADLDDLVARWSEIKPLLETLLVDDNVPVEIRQTIFDGLEEELAHLDLLVMHYREYTERHH